MLADGTVAQAQRMGFFFLSCFALDGTDVLNQVDGPGCVSVRAAAAGGCL
ncbi:hypothetical protein IF1G_03848 [Cordyceps javanica]|uniref:Uncharacterized protein n=1 Tax=Cordyceps javanica TaxID=43265 RepID=A0A545V8R5_9HYPO|nr:hypothetical protein IF1G_03848 [Cordyceps javanica]